MSTFLCLSCYDTVADSIMVTEIEERGTYSLLGEERESVGLIRNLAGLGYGESVYGV